jgi:hypothetical protein
MWESILGLATNLVGGIIGESSAEKTADEIRKQKIGLSRQTSSGLGVAERMAYAPMPGESEYRQQISELMPTTLNQAKDLAQSPSSIIDMASKSLAQTNKAYNELAINRANFDIGNMRNLQESYFNVGRQQNAIDMYNTQTNLAAIGQEAQGTKDLVQGMNNAGGAFIQGQSNQQMNDYMAEMLKLQRGYFGTGSDGGNNYGLGGKITPTDLFSSSITGQGQSSHAPYADYINKMPLKFSYEDLMKQLLQPK